MKGYNESNIFTKIRIIISIFFNRNKIICHDYKRKSVKNIVNLNYWCIDYNNDINNLGDYLSLVVYKNMLSKNQIPYDKRVSKTKHLYSIGSILLTGFQDSTIWGSGILKKLTGFSGKVTIWFNKHIRKLDIRAVRGPLTRDYLVELGINCPEVYGDPAILMPLFYKPNKEKTKDILLINHYTNEQNKDYNSIDLKTKDYEYVIDKICEAKLVISGSLHGIILAESYGVPAILLKDREDFDLFKYNDYYYSTGRKDFPIAETIEEALSFNTPKLPDLSQLQKGLLESFPYDLWNEKNK